MRECCVEAALKSMFAWEQELEEWLATDVVAAAEELAADPSTALSIEQVRATIQAEIGETMAPEKTQSVTELKGMFGSTVGSVSIEDMRSVSGPPCFKERP